MSRSASVEFDWADSTYVFRLGVKQLEELQEKTDAGPAWLYARIEAGMWKTGDLVETIRLGLIGGGKTPDEARSLVRRHVHDHWSESIKPAKMILAAAIAGPEDEPLKKEEGEAETTSPSPTESSASLISMEAVP